MTEPMTTNASNAQELQQAVIDVMARHSASRPRNTTKQYKNKQDEFCEWCTSKKFLDGSLVYESKLVDYIDKVIIPRGNKRKKNKDGTAVKLGYEAVDAYVKAIIDLYQSQKSISMNQHPHPRGKALKALMDMLRRGENKRKIEMYADRGLGTVLDGYNLEDMKALSTYWMKLSTGQVLRSRVDFFVGHALLARGESRRFIQFPDMLTLSLADEGPQVCTPLVVTMRKGKTNQNGRVEYGAAMRCKEVLLCPLNAVAMYLFWRWHVELEVFPDFSDRKNWYDIRLLKGDSALCDMAYLTQLDGVKSAFKACGIDSSVWTHANRGSGAKLAELHGADENQIRRAGRWNNERMESCYLTTLPRKAMRALAGFPTKGGGYWLARGSITPPTELQKMVFPLLDKAETNLKSSGKREIAAGGFISMLHDLRVVFLQDSVILRQQFPDHSIWKAPLFATLEYKTFESEVLLALPTAEAPADQRLEAIIPEVASTMKAGFESLHAKIDGVLSELNRLKDQGSMFPKQLVISLADDVQTSGVQTPHAVPVNTAQSNREESTESCNVRLSRALTTVVEVWM